MDKEIVIVEVPDQKLYVRLRIDGHYRALMEAVRPASASPTDQFLASIQVIVWASLLVEAVVNRVAGKLLNLNHVTIQDGGLWTLAERAELVKKVAALAQEFESDAEQAKRHVKQVERLVRIRNRLVHYKEPPTPVDESFLAMRAPEVATYADLLAYMSDVLPDPDIVSAVRSMPLEERKSEACEVVEWLESLKVR
ncbi:MAG TPA: hypothetical protein VFH27_14200 [Longimicrobiaceae bacterium]|nr:hypothetical protein [Longimicrobiaceae bacterium]